jgi:preprotein translocase subunit SecE
MNTKIDKAPETPLGDYLKYAVTLLIAAAGFVGYSYFAEWPNALRVTLAVVGLVLGAGFFAFTTAKGAVAREYLSETRFELRKVVWPSRQETLRGTGLIIVVVTIISLLLALIDLIIGSGIRALLGN